MVEIERAAFPDPWSRRSFADAIGNERMRALAIDDEHGRLVGYAMSVYAAGEGEVLNLAVAAPARGRGAGRALLQALLDDLRSKGAREVFLEVRRSNEAAIGLYRAFGFEPLGVRPAYYGRPREDALTMVLQFASQSARNG